MRPKTGCSIYGKQPYSGKHRPALYLDPDVRAGISTFAAFADEAEVPRGLATLGADIESGPIEEVMARYAHGGGDYLSVTARVSPGVRAACP